VDIREGTEPAFPQLQNQTRGKEARVRGHAYNPTGRYDGSSRDTTAAFKHVLDRARVPATVRLTRGRDIAAACGQLAAARIGVQAQRSRRGVCSARPPSPPSLAAAPTETKEEP
jgi:adenine C2-methylase RlmN of 23S rRNA A2503 and tRNA A37